MSEDAKQGDWHREMVESLATLLEQLGPIKEAAQGYRAQLIADGWNETSAEKMGIELHNALIRKVFGS